MKSILIYVIVIKLTLVVAILAEDASKTAST